VQQVFARIEGQKILPFRDHKYGLAGAHVLADFGDDDIDKASAGARTGLKVRPTRDTRAPEKTVGCNACDG
jgi:hypothetical protein